MDRKLTTSEPVELFKKKTDDEFIICSFDIRFILITTYYYFSLTLVKLIFGHCNAENGFKFSSVK